ncbi:hypothetical protein C8J56DRAFT_1045487 [Mycena floridula]|nr:hypothetical protein C8J56DRAFT_1045487 [Mycena floridula]
MPRPALPNCFNPKVKETLDSGLLPQVKYQVLSCQGQDILVGRLKIETPTSSGHAFILRRYDTGAVSLTTMFRAAFPDALDLEEKAEVQWVKENYDLAGNNGSSREPHLTRLAGTWVDPATAVELGTLYALGELIHRVVSAEPDPDANYRRSGKGSQKDDATPPRTKPPSKSLPTPSPTTATPNPAKRRREASPAPVPVVEATPKPARRSTRAKSPAAKSKPSSSVKAPVSKAKKTAKRDIPEEVDEESQSLMDLASSQLLEEDVAEQKELIRGLKAQRQSPKKRSPSKENCQVKRSRPEDEDQPQFEFKEPEVGERAIATNKRVGLFKEPTHKSVAWGVAAFVFGAGAIIIPSFF